MIQTIKFLRPCHWFYFLSLPLLSFDLKVFNLHNLFLAIFAASCCLGYAYGLNNIRDARSDLSKEKNPLVGTDGLLQRKFIPILTILVVIATSIGLFLGTVALIAVSVQLLASTLYSAGPRLKGIAILGTITNIAIFTPLCFIGGSEVIFTVPFWLLATVFSLLILQSQLIHEVADYEEDLNDQAVTTAIKFGKKRTLRLSGFVSLPIVALVVFFAVNTDHVWLVTTAIPFVAFSMYTFFKINHSNSNALALRVLHRISGLACGGLIWVSWTFF